MLLRPERIRQAVEDLPGGISAETVRSDSLSFCEFAPMVLTRILEHRFYECFAMLILMVHRHNYRAGTWVRIL
jgi:hypothetical protein